jgi:hypothetical protein
VAISPITFQSGLRKSLSQDTQVDVPVDQVDSRVTELVKENAFLEKVSPPNFPPAYGIDRAARAAARQSFARQRSVRFLAQDHATGPRRSASFCLSPFGASRPRSWSGRASDDCYEREG